MLDKFENAPSFALAPNLTDQFKTWIPVRDNINTTVDIVDSEDGSKALKYKDPDGSYNGVYAIYPNAVPATGIYQLRCQFKIYETPSNFNAYEPYVNFVLGVKVNGTHRPQGSPMPDLTLSNSTFIETGYLTNLNDSNKPYVYITTPSFNANAGDNLCVYLTSDRDYTGYHSAVYPDSYVIIENLQLLDTLPVSLSAWTLE